MKKIIVISIIALLAVTLINGYLILSSSLSLGKRISELKELNRPAQIEVIKLDAECNDCFKIDPLLDEMRAEGSGFNITSERAVLSSSSEGQELIERYQIRKLPTLLIRGELNRTEVQDFELRDDALVFLGTEAPYVDARSGNSLGFVSVINIVDTSCKECQSLETFASGLKKSSVFIKEERTVEYSSAEGKELIKRFDIKHVPALLISQEISAYPNVLQQLLTLQAKEKAGFYAVHSTVPPYRNLTSNKIVGLVEFIMLKDDSCKECYDVAINKQILQRFGMYLAKESTYDVSSPEGKALLKKYDIKQVPMILVSPEASSYPTFVAAWDDVGNKADDGWYIMRGPELLGTIKDLTTGQIIGEQEQQSPQA